MSTGRRRGWLARPYQQKGDIVNALPWDEHGYLYERADGVRWVVGVGMVTISNVVLMVVVGRGLEANESPWD